MLEHEFIFSSSTILYEKVILSNKSSLSDGVKKTEKKADGLNFGLLHQNLHGGGWLLEIGIFNWMIYLREVGVG